ncbi:serine/threonine-protein kinase 40-like [Diadema setosum]|uniref:serine/threonine-protein kinase 40-like n=1 Tax=Diadema setosum TaxID=31175 RepID=UPI003B3AF21A
MKRTASGLAASQQQASSRGSRTSASRNQNVGPSGSRPTPVHIRGTVNRSLSSLSSDLAESPAPENSSPVFQEQSWNVPQYELQRTRPTGPSVPSVPNLQVPGPSSQGRSYHQHHNRHHLSMQMLGGGQAEFEASWSGGQPRVPVTHARQQQHGTGASGANGSLRIPHLANVPVTNQRTMLRARRMEQVQQAPQEDPTPGLTSLERMMAAGPAVLTSLQLGIPGSPPTSGYPSPTASYLSPLTSDPFPYGTPGTPPSSLSPSSQPSASTTQQSQPQTTVASASTSRCASSSSQTVPTSSGLHSAKVPTSGSTLKRAGPYLLGPRLGTSPVRSIVQCLARKDGTDDFYSLKILTLSENGRENQDERQGKMLLHTEYSLLSLLRDQEGVVHHHGLFQDRAYEIRPDVVTGKVPSSSSSSSSSVASTSSSSSSSKVPYKKRLCLVLDCLVAHDFSNRTADLVNLQHHVIQEKKLSEKEAVYVFHDVVSIVDSLHSKNIVHRDLKLGNMVLNRHTRQITLTNFCLGKHLVSEQDLLKDQRGSPAYISPDVLSGKPYMGKPSDMWALGVVLFTMLYGQFPFYDSAPQELFRKIKAAEFTLPQDGRVSENTNGLIRSLLVLDPSTRLTASQVLESVKTTLAMWRSLALQGEQLQVVPDIDNGDCEPPPAKKHCELAGPCGNLELDLKLHRDKPSSTTVNSSVVASSNRMPRLPLSAHQHPPVRRLNQDAQPLSASEIINLCNMLS